jgi:hypothetical protein
MRRRKRYSDISSEGSFDSFLSTVTKNGLGMLVLLAMASTVSSQLTLAQPKFKRSLGTPLVKPAPAGLSPVYLDCTKNRVLPIDMDFLKADVDRYFRAFGAERDRVARELNAAKRGNAYHEFEFIPSGPQLRVLRKAKGPDAGHGLDDFKANAPAVEALFRRWNPRQQYLYFLVVGDSFEVFREVRQYAQARGFAIGWEPRTSAETLYTTYAFGPGGGPPPVDHLP